MFDVPRLDGIAIDGQADDWAGRGFHVAILTEMDRPLPAASDLDAQARLGWDNRGLLLLVEAFSHAWHEPPTAEEFWKHDSIQMLVAAPDRGLCEFRISPGMDSEHPQVRLEIVDQRRGDPASWPAAPVIHVQRTRQGQRCVLEALVPWENFRVDGAAGAELGLMLIVCGTDAQGVKHRLRWTSAATVFKKGRGLRMAEQASPTVNRVVVSGCYEQFATGVVRVDAVGELAGRAVRLLAGPRQLACGVLERQGRRAGAVLTFPAAPRGQGASLQSLTAQVQGEQPLELELPNLDALRAIALMEARLAFRPADGEGEAVGACDFEDPVAARQLIGPYCIETVFYDASYRPVASPREPGLYGAVATVRPEEGPAFWRFCTVARGAVHGEPVEAPHRWRIGLRRWHYGFHKRFTRTLAGPRPVDGPPAPVLRPGTPAQAGMSAEGIAAIDAVCRRWVEEVKEPFSALVARGGVIAHYRAYGQLAGRAWTVQDRSWLASITKTLAATLTMMAVDQGLLDLDDPVSRYLPAFASVPMATPLTLRHLLLHTSDIPMHGSREDLAESAVLYAPCARPGERFDYSSVGPTLARDVLETITGEELSTLYRRCLLAPLGCLDTTVSDMDDTGYSTPMDLATLAQMLLNRGAYGEQRYFSEQAWRRMLPPEDLSPDDMAATRGLGMRWFVIEGLGRRVLGHSNATGSILRIDLDHDLVIVTNRDLPGKDTDRWAALFLTTVAKALLPARK